MAATVQERLSALEAQVAQLLAEKKTGKTDVPWYEHWKGAFQDDEMYDEAMRLGAEYRRSQPTAEEEIEALEKAGVHVPLPDGQ
ncbi:MAG: hypothetical protein JO250_19115 [Armatimonadetes bacterium]|nr:hypothetical protein [Armatimonadota bacterium]